MTDRIYFQGKKHVTQEELEAAMNPGGFQSPLFDGQESQERKEEGISRVDGNEPQEWKDLAFEQLLSVARSMSEFTADDVRNAIDLTDIGEPHHYNVYGALMKRAEREGVCVMTNRMIMSERKDAHRHRNPVWRSLIR